MWLPFGVDTIIFSGFSSVVTFLGSSGGCGGCICACWEMLTTVRGDWGGEFIGVWLEGTCWILCLSVTGRACWACTWLSTTVFWPGLLGWFSYILGEWCGDRLASNTGVVDRSRCPLKLRVILWLGGDWFWTIAGGLLCCLIELGG